MSSSALSTPAYRRFLIGSTITTHGLWILRLSLGWQAWQLTESEFFVAAVAFAAYFPVAVLGPVFGAYADRWDRRRAARPSTCSTSASLPACSPCRPSAS